MSTKLNKATAEVCMMQGSTDAKPCILKLHDTQDCSQDELTFSAVWQAQSILLEQIFQINEGFMLIPVTSSENRYMIKEPLPYLQLFMFCV